MPKLSSYTRGDPDGLRNGPISDDGREGVARTGLAVSGQRLDSASLAGPPSQTAVEAEIERVRTEADRRDKRLGGRRYRWPDGLLRGTPPPPDPVTVANRMRFSAIVAHARVHGGDPAFDQHGWSARHGIGVAREQQDRYLAAAGITQERTADGEWVGFAERLAGNPVLDPSHAFNTYYKNVADQILVADIGRLLNVQAPVRR